MWCDSHRRNAPSGPRRAHPLSDLEGLLRPGRAASIAATTAASSGSTWGAKRATVPSGGDQELLEVPADVAGVAVGVGDVGQLGVERVPAVAVDLDLLRTAGTSRRRWSSRTPRSPRRVPGSWPTNWLHGNAEDGEAAVGVAAPAASRGRVLRGEPALRGDVDNEHGLAPVLAEVRGSAPQAADLYVEDRHGADPRRWSTPATGPVLAGSSRTAPAGPRARASAAASRYPRRSRTPRAGCPPLRAG